MDIRKLALGAVVAISVASPCVSALEPMTVVGYPYAPQDLDDGLNGAGLSSLAFSLDGSVAYSITTDNYEPNQLISINPSTGVGTIIGVAGDDHHISDLATQPGTGVIFGSYWGDFITINPTNGFVQTLGSIPDDDGPGGLAFAPDGTLYFLDGKPATLYTLNPADGSAVSSRSVSSGHYMGLGIHPMTGALFAARRDDPGAIYTIDPATGVATAVGRVTCPAGGVCYLHDIDFNPLSGTMYGVIGGANGSVDPNDLVGAFVRWGSEEPTPIEAYKLTVDAVAATGNSAARGAATVIDSNQELSLLFLGLTSDQTMSDAVSQTLPLITGGSQVAGRAALGSIKHIVRARQASNRGLSSGDIIYGDNHVWAAPFGSWSDQDDNNGVSGYDANTWGFAVGVDGSPGDRNRLGVAFAYANSTVDSNSSVAPQSVDVDVFQFVLYGSHDLSKNTELSFQADVGRNTNDGQRIIALTSTQAQSDFDSTSLHLGLGVAHTYTLNAKTSFVPSIRADFTRVKDNAYTETGAGLLNLSVNRHTTNQLILSVDGMANHSLDDNTTLSANVGVGYDVKDEDVSVTSVYAGAPGASFVTTGIDQAPWLLRGGVGLVHELANGTEIMVRYDAEVRTDFVNQTASIKARWKF
jgi:outer membrane autotransporter protein